eukprot:CAMPEP_0185845182 /NCGR_PEP_ID=MMETSP1354-20130828/1211_1 /TAXON_ID=708628 /ORGANISM="Erythrolobus madagascarensis, Strain CCMP3276" /LENGTH=577 /DNA_ID=CAMNT_0028545077 /DNA_START=138 /DNA_END=1871 /DNA_ORIENTATION=+
MNADQHQIPAQVRRMLADAQLSALQLASALKIAARKRPRSALALLTFMLFVIVIVIASAATRSSVDSFSSRVWSNHFSHDAGVIARIVALSRVDTSGFRPVQSVIYNKTGRLKPRGNPHSQAGQTELLVGRLLPGKRNGTYFELASHLAFDFSNTFDLERALGWNGVCVEANPQYLEELIQRRCRLLYGVAGKEHNEKVEFVYTNDPGLEGILGPTMDNKQVQSNAFFVQTMRAVPLGMLLDYAQMPSVIDYFSFDVEGAEDFVLDERFPFDRYTFLVITIERPKQVLVELLERNRYRLLRLCASFGETVFVHETLPNFQQIMDELYEVPNTATVNDTWCRAQLAHTMTKMDLLQPNWVGHESGYRSFSMHVGFAEEPRAQNKSAAVAMLPFAQLANAGDRGSKVFVDADVFSDQKAATVLPEEFGWAGICVPADCTQPDVWKVANLKCAVYCHSGCPASGCELGLNSLLADANAPQWLGYLALPLDLRVLGSRALAESLFDTYKFEFVSRAKQDYRKPLPNPQKKYSWRVKRRGKAPREEVPIDRLVGDFGTLLQMYGYQAMESTATHDIWRLKKQ